MLFWGVWCCIGVLVFRAVLGYSSCPLHDSGYLVFTPRVWVQAFIPTWRRTTPQPRQFCNGAGVMELIAACVVVMDVFEGK